MTNPGAPNPIRVVVIDDSAYNRQTIAAMLDGQPGVQVVGRAADGEEGLKLVFQTEPHIITLDLDMPRMDGFTFLRILMARRPTPVIVISGQGSKENVFKSLELGALDFVVKPSRQISPELQNIREDLIAKVRLVTQLRPVAMTGPAAATPPPPPTTTSTPRVTPRPTGRITTRPVDRTTAAMPTIPTSTPPAAAPPSLAAAAPPGVISGGTGPIPTVDPVELAARVRETAPGPGPAPVGPAPARLVCIGASTGGPPALLHVLSALDPTLPAGLVITQHMPPRFTRAFAERLHRLTRFHVREAEEGNHVTTGVALVAPGDASVLLRREGDSVRVSLEKGVPGSLSYVPSVDRMCETAADAMGPAVLAVVLTGMAGDGTRGVRAVKTRGGRVIAESPESAVIPGMPSGAIGTGAVDEVCALRSIPEAIDRFVRAALTVGGGPRSGT